MNHFPRLLSPASPYFSLSMQFFAYQLGLFLPLLLAAFFIASTKKTLPTFPIPNCRQFGHVAANLMTYRQRLYNVIALDHYSKFLEVHVISQEDNNINIYQVQIQKLNTFLHLPFKSGAYTRLYTFSDSNISSIPKRAFIMLVSHPLVTRFTLMSSSLFFQTH